MSRLDALLADFDALDAAARAAVLEAAATKRLPALDLADLFPIAATEAELDQLAAIIDEAAW